MKTQGQKESPRPEGRGPRGPVHRSDQLTGLTPQVQDTTKAGENQAALEPSKWYQEQMWRTVYDAVDPSRGRYLRKVLGNPFHSFFPTRRIDLDDTTEAQSVVNRRAALHDIIDELPAEEMIAVYEVARALLLTGEFEPAPDPTREEDAAPWMQTLEPHEQRLARFVMHQAQKAAAVQQFEDIIRQQSERCSD